MAIHRIVSGFARITSPLNEKSRTSVSSSAPIVIGVSTWRNFSSNHCLALRRDDPLARQEAGDERQRHVDADRQQQRLPRHRQAADAQQEAAQHAVEHEHRERVDGDHDERVAVVAAREVAPDEDHRGAGCDAEQDAARQIAPPERNLEQLDAVVHDDLARAVAARPSADPGRRAASRGRSPPGR